MIEEQFIGVPAYDDAVKNGTVEKFLKDRMSFYDHFVEGGYKKIDEIIETELQRLEELWNLDG